MRDEISSLRERIDKLEAKVATIDLTQSLSHRKPIQLTDTICSSCGKACKVPFVPKDNRPLYCRECYQKNKGRR